MNVITPARNTRHPSATARPGWTRWPSLSQRLLERCRARGATQAEVSCSEESGLNVNVRMGEVETVESTRDRGIAVTVYFGQRKGSASTADLREDSLDATVEQACAIARHTEDDAAAGLADRRADGRRDLREFDAWHPWAIDADHAIDLALACEAGRPRDRSAHRELRRRLGRQRREPQRLCQFARLHRSRAQHPAQPRLRADRRSRRRHAARRLVQHRAWRRTISNRPAAIGRKAAERAVSRLAPRQIATGEYPVLFAAEKSRAR